MPCLSAAMLRSKARAASSSVNTESIGRRRPGRRRAAPRSAPAAGGLARRRSTRCVTPLACGGSSATETSRPPRAARRGRAQPLAAGGVEDEVDGFDARVPRPGGVVDDDVGAELPCALDAARRRRGGHVGAVAAGQRRGELADPAGGPVDEHALARGEPAVLEKPLPGAERGERHGGRLGVAERTRLGREQLGRDRGVVGRDSVAVERGHPVHLVTDGQPVDAGPEGSHDAGQLIGGDRREPVDWPLELVARERRRVDAHERLVRRPAPGSRPARGPAVRARRRRAARPLASSSESYPGRSTLSPAGSPSDLHPQCGIGAEYVRNEEFANAESQPANPDAEPNPAVGGAMPRNEGVAGSSPAVGSEVPAKRALLRRLEPSQASSLRTAAGAAKCLQPPKPIGRRRAS